ETFDGLYTDRGVVLAEAGTYALTVYGATASTTGTYSFQLHLVPEAEQFEIAVGDTVDGEIEVVGARDVYSFDAAAGQRLILDAQSPSTNDVRWSLTAPDGTTLFDS